MKAWMVVGLCVCLAAMVTAEEGTIGPEPTEEAAPKRKKVRKLPEYKDPELAMQVAEELEQPILAFIEVQGDKNCNKIRTGLIGRPEFLKEFVPANVVFFHFVIPAEKEKSQGGRKSAKNAPAKPDLNALKPEVKAVVSRFLGQKPSFPVITLMEYSGRVLDAALAPDPEELQFGSFIGAVKNAMENTQYPVTISPRLQKALDREAKALEKAARHKK